LSGHRSHPGETDAYSCDCRSGGERAVGRLPGGDQSQAQQHRQYGVGDDSHDQGGGEAGEAAHDRGTDQLGAARFLALPAVPHYGERAHQGGEDR
jgi:hypothetical protein